MKHGSAQCTCDETHKIKNSESDLKRRYEIYVNGEKVITEERLRFEIN